MSDSPQGPGWWLASDGKWYPPSATTQVSLEQVASARTTRSEPSVPTTPLARKRSVAVTVVWVAVAVAAVAFAGVVGYSLRSDESDGRSIAQRELGIATASGDSTHPPQRDLVVPLDSCGSDGASLLATGQLVNHTGEAASYYVVVLFRTAEHKVATKTVRVDDVPPGGSATFQASTPAPAAVPASFKCRVTRVERWPASAPAPAEPKP